MKKFIAVAAAALIAVTLSAPVSARPGGPGGPGHGPHGPHAGQFRPAPPPFHGPRHWHGWGYYDYAWPIGLGLFAITATAALANSSSSAQVIEAQPVQPAPAAPVNISINAGNGQSQVSQPAQDYFYCPAQNGYYPMVPRCPTGWVKISPQN